MHPDTIPELNLIFRRNFHYFLLVLLSSVFQTFLSWFSPTEHDGNREYSWLFLILMVGSMPLAVFNPPVWFAIYMITFIHMLFFIERKVYAYVVLTIVLLTVYIDQYRAFRRRAHERELDRKIPHLYEL